jgi:hypothetical protein
MFRYEDCIFYYLKQNVLTNIDTKSQKISYLQDVWFLSGFLDLMLLLARKLHNQGVLLVTSMENRIKKVMDKHNSQKMKS